MSKHCFDHFSLTESILAENVQMLSSCDCCTCLLFLCMLADFSEKCSKCVCVKKSCSFFSQSFFCVKISCFLYAHEKLKQDQIIMKKEKEYLILHLFKLQSKNLCLHYHQKFLKKYDDKLIQENVKVFKKKLCILKKKQDFTAFLSNSFSNLLISEISMNIIFSVLSDDF